MKKEYIRPIVVAVTLATEPMMNITSAESGGVNVGNKPVGGNTPDLANRYNGKWGDLWGK